MKTKLKNIMLALGSLAVLGAASQASAFPAFYIQPGAVNPLDTVNQAGSPAPGGLGPLDNFSGSAGERLLAGPNNTFSGNGLLTISGFFNGQNQKYVPGISGAAPFQMYITFTLTDTLTGGTYGAPGSTYSLSQLDFKIWADPLNNDNFTTATSSADPTATNATDDLVLAYGSLLAGNAVVNQGGASTGGALNSTQSLFLCSGVGTSTSAGMTVTGGSAAAAGCAGAQGANFFYFPSPFYAVAFDAFNNTSAVFSNGALVLTGGVGTVNFVAVPEPGTVALFGIAAAALGLSSRRRKS